MEVKNIDIDKYLSTTFYDPSPHRFGENEKPISERKLPVVYTCENCDYSISFKTDDFKKHNELNHSNLEPTDKKAIDERLKAFHLKDSSFLDFYCPKCKQATNILFTGGPSGYWGEYTFKISHVFVIKQTESEAATDDNQAVSNQRYFFSPSSPTTLKFERKLNKRKIQYLKNQVSILTSDIAYSFFEKDIEIVNSIFDEIEKESNEYEKRNKDRKKRQKVSPKARQKRIAFGLLLVLLTFIIISLIL
jgi:hypothetical protein